MDLLYLGKRILFFSFALLTGLFITQAIIEAHTTDSGTGNEMVLEQEFAEQSSVLPLNERIRGNIRDWVGETDTQLNHLDSEVIRQQLTARHKNGDALAYVAGDRLYLINAGGSILAPADSSQYYDLPVITGDSLQVYASTLRMGGEDMEAALRFIRIVKRHYPEIYGHLSEIHIDHRFGLIANTRFSTGVPFIIGRGEIETKIKKMHAFLSELGHSELAFQAKYLDFRLDGQIIVKKRV